MSACTFTVSKHKPAQDPSAFPQYICHFFSAICALTAPLALCCGNSSHSRESHILSCTVLWQQLSLKGQSHTLLQVRQGARKFSALNLRTKFCKKTQFRLSGKCMQRSQPHTCAWHAHASCSVVSGEERSHVSHEQLRLLQRSKVPCMHGVPLSHTPCSAERVPGSLK